MSTLNNPLAKKPALPIPTRIGVVGAGTIGPDIAYYLLTSLPGVTLQLVDIAPAALSKAVDRLKGYAAKGLEKKKLSAEAAAAVSERLVPTSDLDAVAGCDWVLEAATENLALKKELFTRIEGVVRPEALITSNTSSLPAERLFSHLRNPGRATVTHFFAPAHRNPAVEVVKWKQCAPQTLELLRWVFCHTGKVPLVTGDAVCFMLDRVFDNWCNEAALLLDHATASEVDTVASELVQAGPFYVLNLARGNPIIVETNTLQMEEGACYRPANIFRSVDTWKTVAPGKAVPVAPDVAAQVRERLLGIVFSQAVDIADRYLGSLEDLDLGCQLALGFKQGPLELMAAVGASETARIFRRLSRERPGLPLPKQPLESYQGFRRAVLVDDLDGVKVLTLRRPQALNALDDRTTDELLAAIREHEGDPQVQGFVITGYGPKAFCAGADIGRFPKLLGDAAASAQYARDCSRLLLHLDRMKKPVVAALNGMALGGGLELAMRCHALVALGDAFLQLPEVGLGIAPGIGGLVVPYRRWPKAADELHKLVLQTARLKAPKAHDLGIVDALADSYEGLLGLAVKRVKELAGAPRPSLDGPVAVPPAPREAKSPVGQVLSAQVVELVARAVAEAAAAPTLEEALEVGYRAFGATACTEAAREGVTAFLEKRTPDFGKTG